MVEARSPDGDFFGTERLIDVLAACPSDPETVVKKVLSEVDRFTGSNEPYDDLTLLAVSRQMEVGP